MSSWTMCWVGHVSMLPLYLQRAGRVLVDSKILRDVGSGPIQYDTTRQREQHEMRGILQERYFFDGIVYLYTLTSTPQVTARYPEKVARFCIHMNVGAAVRYNQSTESVR